MFSSQTFFLSLVGLGVFEGVLLGLAKIFGSHFLGCHWWHVKPLGGISFIFRGFRFHLRLMGLKLTPFCPFFFLFFVYLPIACQCYEEVSSSHAKRRRGIPREMPTANSLVVAMSVEELGLYSQVPTEISMGMSNGSTTSIVREADNDIYFIRE